MSENFDRSKYKVLVVDDENLIADILNEELEDLGYQSFSVYNAKDALEVIEKESIDLVISDIKMPIASGIDLLKESIQRNPESPVFVMMTGYADFDENILIKMGAKKLLDKPFNFDKIDELVKSILLEGSR